MSAERRSMEIPEIRRREKCETCAFRIGTEANKSKLTLIKAKLCADAAIPFLCHEDTPKEVMCAGFTDMFAEKLANPEFKNRSEWKVELAGHLLEMIDDAEEGKLSAADYSDRMRDIVKKMDGEFSL